MTVDEVVTTPHLPTSVPHLCRMILRLPIDPLSLLTPPIYSTDRKGKTDAKQETFSKIVAAWNSMVGCLEL